MLIVLKGLFVDLHVSRALTEFIIDLPFVNHLIWWRIEPAELKIEVAPILVKDHVHLDFLDGNQDPGIVFATCHLWDLGDFRTLELFHFGTKGFGGVIEMTLGETTANYGIVLLASTA